MNDSCHDSSVDDLFLAIVQSLVEESDAVQVFSIEHEGSTTIYLRVAESDFDKVVGKNGRTERSLRTVLSACGMKTGKRYVLKVEQKQLDSEAHQ